MSRPAVHPTYVAPSRRYREARLAQQNRDALDAQRTMREWGYSPVDVREELERIRSDSYDPSTGEVAS